MKIRTLIMAATVVAAPVVASADSIAVGLSATLNANRHDNNITALSVAAASGEVAIASTTATVDGAEGTTAANAAASEDERTTLASNLTYQAAQGRNGQGAYESAIEIEPAQSHHH